MVDGEPKIADADLADREWAASTDLTKAPASVIVKADSASGEASTQPGDSEASAEGSLQEWLRREKQANAQLKELELKRQSGELVNAKDFENMMIEEYSRVRTKGLGLPRKAKALLPHLTPADVTVLDNLMREMLEELAKPDDDDQAVP